MVLELSGTLEGGKDHDRINNLVTGDLLYNGYIDVLVDMRNVRKITGPGVGILKTAKRILEKEKCGMSSGGTLKAFGISERLDSMAAIELGRHIEVYDTLRDAFDSYPAPGAYEGIK